MSYYPENPDGRMRPLYWYAFAKHWRRWAFLVVLWVMLALSITGRLPHWTIWPLNVAAWGYVPWQINEIFYSRRVHKEKMKRFHQAHLARMMRFEREMKEKLEPYAYDLDDHFENQIAIYLEAAEEGYDLAQLRQRRMES